MNRYALLFIPLILLGARSAEAAVRSFQGHSFEVSVVSSSSSPFEEYLNGGSNFIAVHEGDEYSIVVRNPLPVRVAAAVTVDGLNTLDGKRTTPSDAQKWIIEPYSSITVRGWQTSDSNLRRFIFTREGSSYAQWKAKRDRRNYTENLGVIGVSYFWSSADLAEKLSPPGYTGDGLQDKAPMSSNGGVARGEEESARRPAAKGRAGTGMGYRQWNPVQRMDFFYDAGMFSPSDVITIRYEFAEAARQPMPFEQPHVPYRYPGNYAPEMP